MFYWSNTMPGRPLLLLALAVDDSGIRGEFSTLANLHPSFST
jgi:hypothetical protein